MVPFIGAACPTWHTDAVRGPSTPSGSCRPCRVRPAAACARNRYRRPSTRRPRRRAGRRPSSRPRPARGQAPAVANAALCFGAGSSSVTSSTLSTAGSRRGWRTTVSRRASSRRSSVTVKRKRRAETALLMLGGCMPLCLWCSWKPRISPDVAVAGERPMEAAKACTCRT